MRKLLSRWLSFGRESRGSVAIEFAAVSIPLFTLIYGIIELGLMFFVGAVLDGATDQFARKVRTGQAATSITTINQAKTFICSKALDLFGCTNDLHLYVSVITDISSVALYDVIDDNGNLRTTQVYNIGSGKSYVLVQAYLPWNSWFSRLGSNRAVLNDGRYLLGSVFLFRNEPFT